MKAARAKGMGMRKETRKLVEELIDKYEDYQDWLEEGDKADDPKWDEFRTDWAYEIMDHVASLTAAFPKSYGIRTVG